MESYGGLSLVHHMEFYVDDGSLCDLFLCLLVCVFSVMMSLGQESLKILFWG